MEKKKFATLPVLQPTCKVENGRTLVKRAATAQELNLIYGLDVGHLANLRCQKRGPKFFKVGTRVYYFLTDVEAYIRRCPVLTSDCEEVRCD